MVLHLRITCQILLGELTLNFGTEDSSVRRSSHFLKNPKESLNFFKTLPYWFVNGRIAQIWSFHRVLEPRIFLNPCQRRTRKMTPKMLIPMNIRTWNVRILRIPGKFGKFSWTRRIPKTISGNWICVSTNWRPLYVSGKHWKRIIFQRFCYSGIIQGCRSPAYSDLPHYPVHHLEEAMKSLTLVDLICHNIIK